MTNLIAKPIKTRLTLSTMLVAAFLSGCASKINTQSEQNAINDFVAQANIASNVAKADETNWWHKLESKQLNALVNSALANNYNLQTSQLRLIEFLSKMQLRLDQESCNNID